jgi:hypothetical protein
MKKIQPKHPLQLKLKPAAKPLAKKREPKPKPVRKVRLSKSDPDYFSKMGQISAKRRNISPEQFAEWGRLGHVNRDPSTYRGGRPKKSVG